MLEYFDRAGLTCRRGNQRIFLSPAVNFASDNTRRSHPDLAALGAANSGPAPAYGSDDLTAGLRDRLPTLTSLPLRAAGHGTAANGIALSLASLPYGQVLRHEASHHP